MCRSYFATPMPLLLEVHGTLWEKNSVQWDVHVACVFAAAERLSLCAVAGAGTANAAVAALV